MLSATAVNDSGAVVGIGSVNGTNRGFLYAGGVLADLNTLAPTAGVTYLAAYGINAAGQIAGYANATAAGGVAASAYLLTPSVPEPASLATLAGGLLLVRRSRRRN